MRRHLLVVLALVFAFAGVPASAQVSTGGSGANGSLATSVNYAVGKYYRPLGIGTGITGIAGTTGRIQCTLGGIGQQATISSVTSNITTVSSGGNIQWAIYASAQGLPGALIVAGGSASTTTSGLTPSVLSSPTQFGPGSANGPSVWFCEQVDNATVVFTPPASTGVNGVNYIGSANMNSIISTTAELMGISCTSGCNGGTPTFGTWPATLAGSTWADIITKYMPVPFIQFSSVP